MVISELLHATKRFKNELEWLVEAKFFDKVDSTQKRIQQFLPKADEGAVVVIAETQSKGTGRLGRAWASPVGGIWFTIGLPMKKRTMEQVNSFSIVASHLVVNCMREIYNLECQMKWPNDVLYNGKKLAGTLCGTTAKFRKNWFLVGVGINVNNELPSDLSKTATTIKKIRNQAQGRSRLIESIMDACWKAWQEFDRTGFGPYHKQMEGQLVGIGKSAKILIGKKPVEGTVVGIDPQGSLIIKSGSDTKSIQAGEIIGSPS